MTVSSVALVILDGWGLAEPGPGNAISLAETPVFDRLWSEFPHTQLSAQGKDVGLPDGQMGNSEVGHLNLGAGAVVKQDLARIDDAIADGSFFEDEALRSACERARHSPRGRLHLLGLVSDTFQIGNGLDHRHHQPQIARRWLPARDHLAAGLVYLDLQRVDAMVVIDHPRHQLHVSADKRLDGALDLAFHQSAHLQHIGTNGFQIGIELARNMIATGHVKPFQDATPQRKQ